MVTYVVLRSEVPGGVVVATGKGRPVRRWHSTEVLAQRYSQPDQLQKALLAALHTAKADTPRSGKAPRFIRQSCQSFRKGLPKMKSPAAAVKTSTLVKTVGTTGQTNEGVQRAVEDVQRALMFYKDTVVKGITDMLPGSATVVLDMVLSLSLAIDKAFADNRCQRVWELQRALHQSLADLVRWSDQFLLHGDDAPHPTTVHGVVGDVDQAVQALVEVATKEDILHPADDPSSPKLSGPPHLHLLHHNNNNSDSNRHPPRECKAQCNGSTANRNSLPEICTHSPPPSPPLTRQSSPTFRCVSRQLPPPFYASSPPLGRDSPSPSRGSPCSSLGLPASHSLCSSRLSHSLSSDSILHPVVGDESSPASDQSRRHGSSHSPVLRHAPEPVTPPLTHQFSAPGLQHSITHSADLSSPPPLPPKRRSHNRSSSSTSASPLYNTVSSHTSSRDGSLVRSQDVTLLGSDGLCRSNDTLDSSNRSLNNGSLLHSGSSDDRNGFDMSGDSCCRLSTASATNTSSPSQVSPASSLDSFPAQESYRHPGSLSSPHESGALQINLASSLTNNLMRSGEDDAASLHKRVSHLTHYFPDQINMESFTGCSSNSQLIWQSHGAYCERFSSCSASQVTQVSSTKVCHSRVLVESSTHLTQHSTAPLRSSTSSSSSTLSSASEGDGSGVSNVHSLAVPPLLPAKQRHALSTDSPPQTPQLRDKPTADPSPELPPKKSCVGGSNSSMSSGYNSSSSSMLSNSSSHCSSGVTFSNSNTVVRRHTAAYQSTATVDANGDRPPDLPPKTRNKFEVLEYLKCMATPSEFRHSLQSSGVQSLVMLEGDPVPSIVFPHPHPYTPDVTDTLSRACITESPDIAALPSGPPPALPPKQKSRSLSKSGSQETDVVDAVPAPPPAVRTPTQAPIYAVEEEEHGVLELLRPDGHLQRKKEGEDGPDIKGGSPDALIVHACTFLKQGQFHKEDLTYQDAFLTTYRTFITPEALAEKLLYRYHKFVGQNPADRERQFVASNAFSLLICVVEDLAIADLDKSLLQTLSDFQHELLCKAEFKCAKMLRTSLVKKLETRKRYQQPRETLACMAVSTKQMSLLDFKAQDIAEQMTLLDAELFHKVEISEVLIWSQEQNEERSPNLTTFTEHFNNMSYWVRTRILDQTDSRDREKYVVKFIKILKHLRKMNNFNSYLALLSALDSAPIRRLEWQKTITDGLKEYCALIDSSSSFRAYRNALAESSPPCIPYIGLILQDLTFVNIGNSDKLLDGEVNFSKRWQQFHILDNMRRFRKSNYTFKKKERIIEFFNHFEDCKNEDVLWEMSKQIKPTGTKRLQ